jgi:hypothetical protein
MNKYLTIFSRRIRICTTEITSIDFELFSNFYCFDHFNYFDRSEVIFYNRYCNDRVFRNFNTSFKIDSCRCWIYRYDFLRRVFYNSFCHHHRLDHYSELRSATRQNRVDRFDCKTEIDIAWRFRTSLIF